MMVAVLLGALSLGACVENNESASVEAVRNAKAAQLNSIAVMNNAEAEAKKILSESEAAINNAEAAIKNAQAEADKMENEKAKARLEGELAVIKIEAEMKIAQAKAQLEEAKAALIAALDNVNIATKARITTLLGKADECLAKVNSTRLNLVIAKNALIGLKYDLISAQASQEQTIISEKVKKATAEALIAEYKKYTDADKVAAEKAADEAKAKADGLLKINLAKGSASALAGEAYSVAMNDANGTLCFKTLDEKGTAYYTTEVTKAFTVDFTHNNGVAATVTKAPVEKRIAKLNMFQSDVNEASRNLDISKKYLSEARTELDDVKKSQSYKDQQKAVADAKADFSAATTAADKQAAKIALDNAELLLKNLTANEEANVATLSIAVDENETKLAKANQALANVSDKNATAYDAAIVKVLALRDAKADAEVEAAKASVNYSTQQALADGLKAAANGYTNYTDLILAQNKIITDADKAIEDASNVITKEQAIAKKEREIAKFEVDLKVYDAAYADYMAQVEILIKGE